MTNYYTGVGSRKTPEGIQKLMRTISRLYNGMGWVLRSGGAEGADTAFEENSGDLREIYKSDIYKSVGELIYEKAQRIAAQYHPNWVKMPEFAKKLHARNVFQVLGEDLETPSSVVICWTPDGCNNHYDRSIETGGTGTAISIAYFSQIPIINLARSEDMSKINQFIKSRRKK